VIVFRSELISGGMEGSGIHLIRPDGSGLVGLASGARDFYPSISPDGQSILFLSERDGSAEIYLMDLDGSSVSRLTFDNAVQDFAVFAPQGDWIAFAALGETGGYDIYLMPFQAGD
jgi:TolB protein